MHELFIVKKGHAYFVRPAQIGVAPGATFRVVNLTGQQALVFLPELSKEIVRLEAYDRSSKNAHCAEIQVPADARVGFSPFAAFVAEGRDFCEGESAPGIIISK